MTDPIPFVQIPYEEYKRLKRIEGVQIDPKMEFTKYANEYLHGIADKISSLEIGISPNKIGEFLHKQADSTAMSDEFKSEMRGTP